MESSEPQNVRGATLANWGNGWNMEPGAWELPELYDALAETLWLLIGLPSDGSGGGPWSL